MSYRDSFFFNLQASQIIYLMFIYLHSNLLVVDGFERDSKISWFFIQMEFYWTIVMEDK